MPITKGIRLQLRKLWLELILAARLFVVALVALLLGAAILEDTSLL